MEIFPAIRPVSRAGVMRDALAGLTLAAMNVPQALGYTKIAGMPVVTGLYTLLLPLVAFAAFGSSRYLVVAADSATAAILAGALSHMAPVASEQYVALAGFVALLTAGFLLLARLFKLGFLADFLSQTVLVGFLTGVGFQVGIAVLGEMLGVPVDSRRTVEQLAQVLRSLSEVHAPTLLHISDSCGDHSHSAPSITSLARTVLSRCRCGGRECRIRLLRSWNHRHRSGGSRPTATRSTGCELGRGTGACPCGRLVLSDDHRPERSDGARLCVAPSRNARRKRGYRRSVCGQCGRGAQRHIRGKRQPDADRDGRNAPAGEASSRTWPPPGSSRSCSFS